MNTTKIFACTLLLLFTVFIAGCGGGGGGGSSVSQYSGGVPYIYAKLYCIPTGTELHNFQSASVNVIDSSTGFPISIATVTINGVSLNYNLIQQEYQGNPTVDPGENVNLSVTVGSKTYTATGNQFTSIPTISVSTSGTPWQTSLPNTVSWSTNISTTNAFYDIGVYNTDSGYLVWPSNGNLQTVQNGTAAYSIPANSLSVGKCLVIVGIATTTLSIPDTASGSAFVISDLNTVPVTVIDSSGTHWTARQADGSTDDFNGVAWSGTQFVTVGSDFGHILTSPDGATWTLHIPGASNPLNGVAWGNNQFVAVGSGGAVLTSPDGVTWTSCNSGTTASLSDVIWASDRFVAVGTGSVISTGLSNVVLTSTDGANWTAAFPGTTGFLNRVTWSGTQFVAVGGYTGDGSPNTSIILTSTDGVTWTPRTAGISIELLGVTWSGTEFVIVGEGGTILTSPDGITWTQRTSGTTVTLYNVAWSGLNFVAVGQNRTILTSPDAITWTAVTPDYIYSLSLYDIIWAGTQFVAVGEGGSIFSSP